MKKQLLWCMAALSFSAASAQTYETRFARPLSDVLNDVAARFQVRLKYDVDTVGRVLPYADFRAHPTNPVECCADANPKTMLPNDT